MTSPDDLTFSLLPSEDPVITPEENLRLAAQEAVETTLQINPTPEEPTTVAIGRGWAFDFGTGQFSRHGDSPAQVSGEDQIKVWIEKTIYTSRFAHPIYSDQYGTEGFLDLIGSQDPGLYGSISKAISDSLIVHDQIASVDDFVFTPDGEHLFVDFSVTLTTGSAIDVPLSLTGNF